MLERQRPLVARVGIVDRQDCVDGDTAGDLAGSVAAHAVAHHDEVAKTLDRLAVADTVTIFIMVARLADIRARAMTYLHWAAPEQHIARDERQV
jgi:aminoglycoside/choline kinase family phosphotransferase